MARIGAENYEPERFELFGFSGQDEHSVNSAAKLMKWLIEPVGVQTFFEFVQFYLLFFIHLNTRFLREIYTKRAFAINRNDAEYYSNVFSSASFFALFQEVCCLTSASAIKK